MNDYNSSDERNSVSIWVRRELSTHTSYFGEPCEAFYIFLNGELLKNPERDEVPKILLDGPGTLEYSWKLGNNLGRVLSSSGSRVLIYADNREALGDVYSQFVRGFMDSARRYTNT